MNTKIKISSTKLIVSLTLIMATSLTNAQIINNGSFNNSRCVFCAVSPWIIEEGSPDISAPGKKWSVTTNYEFINSIPSSPDGGTFANLGANNGSSYSESIYQKASGLIKGVTYSLEFYQINTGLKSIDNVILYDDEGIVEVYIDGILSYVTPSYFIQKNWVFHTFNFIANDTTQKILFVSKSTNKGSSNSFGLYMGLDGVNFTPPLSLDLINLAIDKNTFFWSTENEEDFSHFELERKKSDENEFMKIGSINSKYGLNNDYSFEDNNHVDGEYFYRLKMIDIDGKFYYSKIVSANYLGDEKSMDIYPNPINFESKVQFTGFENEGEINIFNMLGERLFQQQVVFSQTTELNYFLRNLTQGTYFISARELNSSKVKTVKFLVK